MRKRPRPFHAGLSRLTLGAILSAGLLLAPGVWAQSDWKKDWDKTVDAARKEGQISFYICSTCSATNHYENILEEFAKDYPGIKVVTVAGSGAQLSARETAERRAEKYLTDLHSGGGNGAFNVLYKGKMLDPIKSLFVLPEVVDESKWYGGKHQYLDAEGKHIFVYLASVSTAQLYFNTQLVKPGEFKSYWDIVNPKWKGRIVSLEPSNTGLGAPMQFFYYHPELGPDYIRKLFGTMDVTYSRDYRQMVDWLAQGKFALCLGCKETDRAKNQGLPIDEFDTSVWKEGAGFSAGGGTLTYFNKAPHPHAAKVFVNWFLSKKGQIALQKFGNPDDPPNSRRIDIPKDGVPLRNQLIAGRKYLDVTNPEWSDMTPIFQLTKDLTKGK